MMVPLRSVVEIQPLFGIKGSFPLGKQADYCAWLVPFYWRPRIVLLGFWAG